MSIKFRSPVRKKTGFYTRKPISVHGVRSPLAYKGKFRSPIGHHRMFHVGGGMGGGLGGGMLFGRKNKKAMAKIPKARAPRGLRFRGPGSNGSTKAPKLGGGYRRLWK